MLRIFAILAAMASILFAAVQLTASDKQEGWTEYSAASFAKAQQSGQTILVDVYAPWCPTCRAQTPILDELRKDTRLSEVAFVKVDFDNDKDFLHAHRISRQSTILVFKGKKEVARSIAETDRTRLRSFVLDAI